MTRPAGDLRRSRLVSAIVVLLFVVPAVILLVGPKPSRFGFQMYSGYGNMTAAWTDATGRVRSVDLDELIVSGRVEIDWTTFLPEEICRRVPAAVRAEVSRTQPGGVQRRAITC